MNSSLPTHQPITQLVEKRFSCRHYLDQPIEAEKRRLLESLIAEDRTGPFGNQPQFSLIAWTEQARKALQGLGTYGFIRNPTGFVVGTSDCRSKNPEDFGYLMERIVLFATDLGLGTCWLGGSFTKSRFAQRVALEPGWDIPAVCSIGIIGRQRSVDPVLRGIAGSDRRYPREMLFFDGRFGVPLSQEAAGDYATPLEMVRLGPSASNKQPWRIVKDSTAWHLYLRRTPGYRRGIAMKLLSIADLQRIDMGIAMCHFELTAREKGLKGEWSIDEPNIEVPDALTEYVASWAAS